MKNMLMRSVVNSEMSYRYQSAYLMQVCHQNMSMISVMQYTKCLNPKLNLQRVSKSGSMVQFDLR